MLLGLLCAMGSARAGYYTVSYSGGSYTVVGRYATQTSPYSLNTNTSEYGVPYAYAQWGVASGAAYSASVTCAGEITATFTYHPGSMSSGGYGGGYGGSTVSLADDPPPSAVVIAETCTASWGGSERITAGSADNTLGFAEVAYGGNSQSSGTRYKIQEGPGTSFTVKCSPQAKVAGTGVVGPPDVYGSGNAFVKYKATASALEVILNGGIGPKDNKKFLIGQHVGATVSTGGLTANSYNWSIGGGEPFKNWTASQTQGHFTALGAETNSTLGFYFKKPEPVAPAIVSCATHLVVPSGSLPVAGLNATPSRECTVTHPDFTMEVRMGDVHMFGTSPNGLGLKLGGLSNSTYNGEVGIVYNSTVTTPPEFTASGIGGWNFVQLITPGRHEVIYGIAEGMIKNGLLCLDNWYPYAPASAVTQPFPANGNHFEGVDAPQNSLVSNPDQDDSVDFKDEFGVWLMYIPPGADSCYVPLRKIWWFWHGAANYQSWRVPQWLQTSGPPPSSPLDCLWDFDRPDYPSHPEWDHLLLNSDLSVYEDE